MTTQIDSYDYIMYELADEDYDALVNSDAYTSEHSLHLLAIEHSKTSHPHLTVVLWDTKFPEA